MKKLGKVVLGLSLVGVLGIGSIVTPVERNVNTEGVKYETSINVNQQNGVNTVPKLNSSKLTLGEGDWYTMMSASLTEDWEWIVTSKKGSPKDGLKVTPSRQDVNGAFYGIGLEAEKSGTYYVVLKNKTATGTRVYPYINGKPVKKFTITVKKKATSFKLAKKKIKIKVGQKYTLKYSFNKNAYSMPEFIDSDNNDLFDYSFGNTTITLVGKEPGKTTVNVCTLAGMEENFELEVYDAKKKK